MKNIKFYSYLTIIVKPFSKLILTFATCFILLISCMKQSENIDKQQTNENEFNGLKRYNTSQTKCNKPIKLLLDSCCRYTLNGCNFLQTPFQSSGVTSFRVKQPFTENLVNSNDVEIVSYHIVEQNKLTNEESRYITTFIISREQRNWCYLFISDVSGVIKEVYCSYNADVYRLNFNDLTRSLNVRNEVLLVNDISFSNYTDVPVDDRPQLFSTWYPGMHRRILEQVLGNYIPGYVLEDVVLGSDYADSKNNQSVDKAYYHAMVPSGKTVEMAKDSMRAYFVKNIMLYRRNNDGVALGYALHMIQDMFSPAHGLRSWNGSIIAWFPHFFEGRLLYPGDYDIALSETRWVWSKIGDVLMIKMLNWFLIHG